MNFLTNFEEDYCDKLRANKSLSLDLNIFQRNQIKFNKTLDDIFKDQFSQMFSETNIIGFFFINNIFIMLDGCVFQQTVAVSMGTNYALVLTDLFLY